MPGRRLGADRVGLTRWSDAKVQVSVPRSARYHRTSGVQLHVLRDRGRVVGRVDGRSGGGPPRTVPEVAALRAAMWARTDREAATVLAVAVQQNIVGPARLRSAWTEIGRCPRAALLGRLVPLVASGAEALSEIDFAELGRASGWPEPDRQVVVITASGRIFLDVRFTAYDTICEVNGVQHYEGMAIVVDAVRRNSHVIDGQTALEIPAVALLLDPQPLLDQVEQALRKGGWTGPGSADGDGDGDASPSEQLRSARPTPRPRPEGATSCDPGPTPRAS